MPQKSRKLVLAGPRDSGKTSWANVFHRLIPPEYIASVTNEGQFSGAMITDATQLVIIDEWSVKTMNSDLAKTILQEGWMVTSVKHGPARCVINNSPFYITTNEVPDFGEQSENVERRVKVFNTATLPTTTSGIDRWIYDNAMHCIAWMANEISMHHDLICPEELWYEDENTLSSVVPANHAQVLWNRNEILQVTEADLEPVSNALPRPDDGSIHPGFFAELRSRRRSRKRQRSRQVLSTDSSSEDDAALKVLPVVRGIDDIEDSASQEPPADNVTNQPEQPAPILSDDSLEKLEEEANEIPVVEETQGNCEEERQNADLEDRPSTSTAVSNDTREADAAGEKGAEYDMNETRFHIPAGGWILNNVEYMDKVANLIERQMYTHLQKGHVHAFSERRRKAALRRDSKEIEFWTKADPEIDAWMLATGNSRDAFHLNLFVQRHSQIVPALEELRKTLNVLVLPSRCPVQRALSKPGLQDEEREDRPKLSSQTYWTTMKKWFGK